METNILSVIWVPVIMFFKFKKTNLILLTLLILLSSFVFVCKGENDEDDEDLLLGLASQQNTSVSGLCKNFANGANFSFDGVNLTSSPQNLIGTSNGNFYAGVLAKGLKANEKVVFNNIAETATPSINAYSGSVCEISSSTESATGTLLSFAEDNLTGIRIYTVTTAGDYFFVVSGTTSNVKAITVVLE